MFSNHHYPFSTNHVIKAFKKYCILVMQVRKRTRSEDKVHPSRNVLEMWSHYLEEEYVPN